MFCNVCVCVCVCVCITGSRSCTSEIETALQINYTTIKKNTCSYICITTKLKSPSGYSSLDSRCLAHGGCLVSFNCVICIIIFFFFIVIDSSFLVLWVFGLAYCLWISIRFVGSLPERTHCAFSPWGLQLAQSCL